MNLQTSFQYLLLVGLLLLAATYLGVFNQREACACAQISADTEEVVRDAASPGTTRAVMCALGNSTPGNTKTHVQVKNETLKRSVSLDSGLKSTDNVTISSEDKVTLRPSSDMNVTTKRKDTVANKLPPKPANSPSNYTHTTTKSMLNIGDYSALIRTFLSTRDGDSPIKVAFGMGMTFRMLNKKIRTFDEHIIRDKLRRSPFFKHFLPSFCKTIERHYNYSFYIGYDYNDIILGNSRNQIMFLDMANDLIKRHCNTITPINIRLVFCNYTGKPAWAQNDAMMTAHADNNDYYYMANDDTKFVTKKWTTLLIEALLRMEPTNVGTVGPRFNRGAMSIMTYNFIHDTHFDIFHYFMPRVFTDWSGDSWITHVYEPLNSRKQKHVFLEHVSDVGQRYSLAKTSRKRDLEEELRKGKNLIEQYIKKIKHKNKNM